MRKYLLSVLLTVAALSASAQNRAGYWYVVPRIGVSIANMTNNHLSTNVANDELIGSKYKAGMAAGADVEYMLTNHLSASLGAYYSMQGCRFPDYVYTAGATYTGYNAQHVNTQYINVPLMVNYYITHGLAVKAGVQVGFLLNAKEKYNTSNVTKNEDGTFEHEESTSYDFSETDLFKKIDVSIPVGVSYEYENVILEARYNIGLTNVYQPLNSTYLLYDGGPNDTLPGDNKYNEPKTKNSNITLTVGYKFKL